MPTRRPTQWWWKRKRINTNVVTTSILSCTEHQKRRASSGPGIQHGCCKCESSERKSWLIEGRQPSLQGQMCQSWMRPRSVYIPRVDDETAQEVFLISACMTWR